MQPWHQPQRTWETTPQGSPEVGTIVHFEHVNLRIPEQAPAALFFFKGLGFTRDPTRMVHVDNMWCNIGLQQIHMPTGEPTPFAGEIGVVVPELDAVRREMAEIAPRLEGTGFAWREEEGTIACTDPWGHPFRVHPFGMLPGRYPQAIAYVLFHVPEGTAGGIAAFYRTVLGCPAALEEHDGRPMAVVTVGPHQTFRFAERPGFTPPAHNNHVAVYLSRYWELYEVLDERGCIMEGHTFEQFRFDRMIEPDTGRELFRFEHEMRSLHHPDFRKPLVNRIPVPQQVD